MYFGFLCRGYADCLFYATHLDTEVRSAPNNTLSNIHLTAGWISMIQEKLHRNQLLYQKPIAGVCPLQQS